MKIVPKADLEKDGKIYKKIAAIIERGGMVAFPGKTAYRLGVDAHSVDAVRLLQQAKRRATNRPALVFVQDEQMLDGLVGAISPTAKKLMDAFWPGPLTIRLKPGDGLDRVVRKTLTKATGKLGVRIPVSPVASRILRAFGRPMLVSSANRSRKTGAQSLAQVKQNFGNLVDLLIDGGDLPAGKPSTIVDVSAKGWKVIREGSIPSASLTEALG
jgi:L-threonylcarbamoyladenylate synthase